MHSQPLRCRQRYDKRTESSEIVRQRACHSADDQSFCHTPKTSSSISMKLCPAGQQNPFLNRREIAGQPEFAHNAASAPVVALGLLLLASFIKPNNTKARSSSTKKAIRNSAEQKTRLLIGLARKHRQPDGPDLQMQCRRLPACQNHRRAHLLAPVAQFAKASGQ